jgi:hypothetical protein
MNKTNKENEQNKQKNVVKNEQKWSLQMNKNDR